MLECLHQGKKIDKKEASVSHSNEYEHANIRHTLQNTSEMINLNFREHLE